MPVKTVIFDIGGVLTRSEWNDLLFELAGTEEKLEQLVRILFYSGIWEKMEMGLLTDEETIGEFLKNGKGFEKEILSFFEKAGERLFQCDFTGPLIRDLKTRGLQVLYLSNWSDHMLRTAGKAMDFLSLMDGGVFSFEEHLYKPDPAIYRRILEKYNLTAAECVFLDDRIANIEAAEACGIRGIHVSDHETAHRELYRMIHAED